MISAASWYAVQTRPQHEHFVAEVLRFKGYEVLLPRGNTGRLAHATRQLREQPLFPGYLFCWVPSELPGMIVTTPGVIRILGTSGRPTPLSVEEIENIRRAVDSKLHIHHWPCLEQGDEVEVLSGPLAGCTGILRNWKSTSRLIISVAMLQRSIAVEVDLNWIGLRSRHAVAGGLSAARSQLAS